jgi:hypothetical protein
MAKVLVAGIYMADQPNTITHLMYQFAAPSKHAVEQRWIALVTDGSGPIDLPNTVRIVTDRTPKFTLLNSLIADHQAFDWIVFCDDDVEVGPGFLDDLIDGAERHRFALVQPARTGDSYVDHEIVRRIPGIAARRTRFVEIGPVTCLGRDAYPLLLPFPDDIGMGWGLDFIWPVLIEEAGLRMGILDAAAVAHRMRPSVNYYSYDAEHRAMSWSLARHRHLSYDEALRVLEVYP